MNQIQISSTQEGHLLNILHNISSLEWVKYCAEYPTTWGKNGLEKSLIATTEPPFIAFRFENESRELISRVKTLIENYQGTIKWELHEHKRENLPGTNWVIRPTKCGEIESIALEQRLSVGEYMSKNHPEFAAIAFEDLNCLTTYIEQGLSDFKISKL